MHAFDERVLGRDPALVELGHIVLDPLRKATAFELREQTELAELRELHSSAVWAVPGRPRPERTGVDALPCIRRIDPADRDHGDANTSLMSRSPSRPIGSESGLLGVDQTGPAPMYVAPSSSA